MKHLELFSGIGGFRRAMDLLKQDGVMDFDCIGYSEIDAKARLTYETNFHPADSELNIGDVVEFSSSSKSMRMLPHFDLLTGGFPCQTFSMMGNKAGFKEDRGQMFFRILDILTELKPKYVLLENVKNLIRHDNGNTFNTIKNELVHLGYKVYTDVFNTSMFHLPQTRNRVVIFATKKEVPSDFTFSAELISQTFDDVYNHTSVLNFRNVLDILKDTVPDKYFLSDKIKPTLLADGSANFKSKSDINMMTARTLTASMHKMHRACQDNYYSQDFIESKGAVNPVLTMSKEDLAKLPIRKLTPEEAFMLQGFPSAFATDARKAGVSDTSLYKQAGNAVSVNTIYAVLYYLIVNDVIKE